MFSKDEDKLDRAMTRRGVGDMDRHLLMDVIRQATASNTFFAHNMMRPSFTIRAEHGTHGWMRLRRFSATFEIVWPDRNLTQTRRLSVIRQSDGNLRGSWGKPKTIPSNNKEVQ